MEERINYIIITPVKDEEKYIEFTIESVIKQTIRPLQWIIVDDGSRDSTGEIIETYSRLHSWIARVDGGDAGPRKPGLRHLKAFYKGLEKINSPNWDYLVKLDGDISFDENYFAKCFGKFKNNPKLGIGGGVILNVVGSRLIPEKQPLFHVRGATKIYSRDCWKAIGGLPLSPCYDTLDEVKANMLGYETQSFPDLKILHHRYTGKSYGMWGSSVKNGVGDFIAGYHPLFVISKCIKRVVEKPYLLGSIGLFYGYISGYLKGIQQESDKRLIAYLRQQQMRRLMFRKTIWR